MPWPLVNRDYVARFVINQRSPGHLTIDSHAEDGVMAEQDGLVRVNQSVAHWDVRKESDGLLHITYNLSFDPAGTVPAWLTNLFVVRGPYQTFQGMRKLIDAPVYRDAKVGFIRE